MDREKLKSIVMQLESLLETLKSEVYSDLDSYSQESVDMNRITDYDEVFIDDDEMDQDYYDSISTYMNPYTIINDDDGDGI